MPEGLGFERSWLSYYANGSFAIILGAIVVEEFSPPGLLLAWLSSVI